MSKALDLARECGVLAYEAFKESDVETFFRRAQAMALRDAVEKLVADMDAIPLMTPPGHPLFNVFFRCKEILERMADELDPPR